MPRTLTALFNSRDSADSARDRLVQVGVPYSEIDLQEQTSTGPASIEADDDRSDSGIWAAIKDFFGAHDDHHTYTEGLRRGHILLTVTVADAQTDQAIQVLEGSDAIDLERSETEWRESGWDRSAGASAQPMTAQPTAGASTQGARDERIDLAEERLVVGKREVERGGVRVRSYIVETPVSEHVTLRQENVGIERRPVDRPVTAGESVFQDRTIEMRETGEEAVVGKQAVVTEEIGLHKEVGERTEEVRDTVRRTEVEVDHLKGGRPQDRPTEPKRF